MSIVEMLTVIWCGFVLGVAALSFAGRPIPDFVDQLIRGVGSWITGGSALAAGIWSVWKKRGANATQMLGWTGGMCVGFCMLVVGLTSVKADPSARRFKMTFLSVAGVNQPAWINISQRIPDFQRLKTQIIVKSGFIDNSTQEFDTPDRDGFIAQATLEHPPVKDDPPGDPATQTAQLWEICLKPASVSQSNTQLTVDCDARKHSCDFRSPPQLGSTM